MYRLTAAFFAVVFTGALGCVAAAQQVETTPIPVQPKPDFSSWTWEIGAWNCSSKSARRATPQKSTVSYALDPSGYWIVGTTKVQSVSWFPHDSVIVDKMTYDASGKHWVDVTTDDLGGYDISSATGWDGDKVVWHDVTYPKQADVVTSNDTTMTKVSDTKTTFVSSFVTKKGATIGVSGECTKG
jgi:hypothetical protein